MPCKTLDLDKSCTFFKNGSTAWHYLEPAQAVIKLSPTFASPNSRPGLPSHLAVFGLFRISLLRRHWSQSGRLLTQLLFQKQLHDRCYGPRPVICCEVPWILYFSLITRIWSGFRTLSVKPILSCDFCASAYTVLVTYSWQSIHNAAAVFTWYAKNAWTDYSQLQMGTQILRVCINCVSYCPTLSLSKTAYYLVRYGTSSRTSQGGNSHNCDSEEHSLEIHVFIR